MDDYFYGTTYWFWDIIAFENMDDVANYNGINENCSIAISALLALAED